MSVSESVPLARGGSTGASAQLDSSFTMACSLEQLTGGCRLRPFTTVVVSQLKVTLRAGSALLEDELVVATAKDWLIGISKCPLVAGSNWTI